MPISEKRAGLYMIMLEKKLRQIIKEEISLILEDQDPGDYPEGWVEPTTEKKVKALEQKVNALSRSFLELVRTLRQWRRGPDFSQATETMTEQINKGDNL